MAGIPTGQAEDPSGIIAALRRQLAERDAALARRDGAYEERLAHQAATVDVLRAMSASPGDPQPVFDLINRQALELCSAALAGLFVFDGEHLHLRAIHGGDPAAVAAYTSAFPMLPARGSMVSRAVLDRAIIHIRDIDAEIDANPTARVLGMRSMLNIPLMRDGVAIGVIGITALEAGGFSDSQIELLQTFAEQAVIAITNAETYRALQARTSDLQESLEQQTATAEVLGVINASPGNLAPVFEAMLEKAMRLCGAAFGVLLTHDDGRSLAVAARGLPKAFAKFRADNPEVKASPVIARILETGQPHQVLDVRLEDGYRAGLAGPRALADLGGARTFLGLPLLQDGQVRGFITVYRQEVRAFTDKQIALLENFAAQAVIAMENARLITETREALEQQTATAEVLQVINTHPGDVAPVFEAILEKAHKLCGASRGCLFLYDGTHIRGVAMLGYPDNVRAVLRQENPPTRNSLAILAGQRFSHTHDLRADLPTSANPVARVIREISDVRTNLIVPLRKDDKVLGFISANRTEVRPYTDSEIVLLESFAAQAVIAMENARLITETREALEQQTATAEVLGVINTSLSDPMPVFNKILEKAHHVCGADAGALLSYDGENFRALATFGYPDEVVTVLRRPVPVTPRTQGLLDGDAFTHIPDAWTDGRVDSAIGKAMRASSDIRTRLFVPLRKDGKLLGMISAHRHKVRPYSDREIDLLQSFAAQAVIAMENARLITETREALEQQTATAEVLGVINANPGNLAPVFQSLLDRSLQLCGAAFGEIGTFDGDEFTTAAVSGMSATYSQLRVNIRTRPGQGTSTWRLRHGESLVCIPDLIDTQAYRDGEPTRRELVDVGGARALVAVALSKDSTLLGQLAIFRREPGQFNDRQIALLQNFAAQAVIAMENARLLGELRTARDTAEASLTDLRRAQDRLVQTEKMASLGQLTAGIAHEIKNPLNFVNNFSDLSIDLLDELNDILTPLEGSIDAKSRADIAEVKETLQSNLRKIVEHGRRADSIVKNMLAHSRTGASERRAVELNATAEEALNLAYHGARAEFPGFNVTLEKDLDPAAGEAEIYPQEFTRVLVNLVNNGFYATRKRAEAREPNYEPTLRLSTHASGDHLEIKIRDNGTGIPPTVREKIFEPFFTTKPPGEGTGLGLSLSFDIVAKQHGGLLTVASEPGAFTEFTITLPRKLPAGAA